MLQADVIGNNPAENTGSFHAVFARIHVLDNGLWAGIFMLQKTLGQGSSLYTSIPPVAYRHFRSYVLGAVCGVSLGSLPLASVGGIGEI